MSKWFHALCHIKPTVTAPGFKRLKLNYVELLSNFGFKFSVRRYTKAWFHKFQHWYMWLAFPMLQVAFQVGDIAGLFTRDTEARGSLNPNP